MSSRLRWAGLSAVIVSVFGLRASAALVRATLDGMPYRATVRIHVESSEASRTEYTYAGLFQWHGVASNPHALQGTFSSFCIDIKDTISFGQTYTYDHRPLETAPIANGAGSGINSDLAGGMGSDRAKLITGLYEAKFPLVHSNATAAAFQLVLWNIVYDQDWTIDTGKFRIDIPSLSIPESRTLANTWLDELHNGLLTGTASVAAMASDRYQDQLIPAPLPSAAWAGLGLMGAVGAWRIRRRMAREQD